MQGRWSQSIPHFKIRSRSDKWLRFPSSCWEPWRRSLSFEIIIIMIINEWTTRYEDIWSTYRYILLIVCSDGKRIIILHEKSSQLIIEKKIRMMNRMNEWMNGYDQYIPSIITDYRTSSNTCSILVTTHSIAWLSPLYF